MNTAVVYDASMAQAQKAADWLEARGCEVLRLTGKERELSGIPAAVDLLVIEADVSCRTLDGAIGTGHDYEEVAALVSDRICDVTEMIDRCLPALYAGEGKRIAFLTESASSVRECRDRDGYARHMILAGLNMQAKILFNRLRKEGFTMRCFAADSCAAKDRQILDAGSYLWMDFSYDEKEPYIHSEENRFVMRDGEFREISW